MTIVTYTAGWAALGFGVRLYQLGLMQRNIFENLGGHVISTGVFGTAGYFVYGYKEHLDEQLKIKREELRQMRAASVAREEMRLTKAEE